MLEGQLDAALDFVFRGSGRQPIQRIIEIATHISQAPIAYIVLEDANSDYVVASHGIPHVPLMTAHQADGAAEFLYEQACVIPDLRQHPRLRMHPQVIQRGWRWLAVAPLPLPTIDQRMAIICADLRSDRPVGFQVLERLQRLAAVAADELHMLAYVAQGMAQTTNIGSRHGAEPAHNPAHVGPSTEPPSVVAEFLLETLVAKHRILTREEAAYHALMTWRRPIKAAQLSALRALKRLRSDSLIEPVAHQMAAASRRLWNNVPAAVIAVPCGNSGEDCFAEQLARRTAALLDLPYRPAFAPIDVKGSSHPRRNSVRPAMRLTTPTPGPVLLIDDVATSGAHLAEAASQLRAGGSSVFSLVWIAG